MSLLPHLQCRPDQIAERVVLCGDPAEVERIAGQLDQCEPLGQHREFRLINGRYRGCPSLCSTGIGGASAVIALEELVQAGARALIRVGSAGALQGHIGLGILSWWRAVRSEGARRPTCPRVPRLRRHPPASRPARPSRRQRPASLARAGALHDSFYRDDEQEVCRYWHQRGVLGADMETASLLAVGRLRKVRVAAVLCNVVAFEQDDASGGERLRRQRSRHDDRRAAGHRRRPPRPDAIVGSAGVRCAKR